MLIIALTADIFRSAARTAAVLAAMTVFMVSAASAHAQPAGDCNQAAPAALTTVKLPGHPFSIVPSPDGCWLFVSLTSTNSGSNGVAVLRRAGGKITLQRVYPMEGHKRWNLFDWGHPPWLGPAGMVMTHDGRQLIVANYAGCQIFFMDVKSLISGEADPVAGTLKDNCTAGSLNVNVTKDDKLLFVSDERTKTISVFDLEKARRNDFSSGAAAGRIPVGITPIALAFSHDQKWLYTTSEIAPVHWNWPPACPPEKQLLNRNREGAVVVIDVQKAAVSPSDSVIARVPAGCGPVRLALSKDGGTLWVSARDSDQVLVFDTAKLVADPLHARIGSVSAEKPVGIAVLPGGKRVVVANSGRNRRGNVPNTPSTITVIDAQKTPAIAGTIPAGVFPRDFSLSPDGRTLFLGNYNSDTLTVIDLENISRVMNPAR